MDFVSYDEVQSRSGQPILSDTIRRCRVSFFGHLKSCWPLPSCSIAHSQSSQRLASQTWQTETILAEDSGGRSTSSQFQPTTARQHALDRSTWWLLVETATLPVHDMLLRERAAIHFHVWMHNLCQCMHQSDVSDGYSICKCWWCIRIMAHNADALLKGRVDGAWWLRDDCNSTRHGCLDTLVGSASLH